MVKKINFSKKGIIFDFDDTLINSKPGKDKALKIVSGQIYSYLKKKKAKVNLNKLYQEIKTSAIQMDAQGIYDRNLWWLPVIKKFLKHRPAESFLNDLTQQYWETTIENSTLFKDVESTLAYLKNKGYLFGLLTDTDGVKGMKLKRIKALNLKKWFDSIIVAGEDTKEIKLSVTPFYLISKKLNLKPKECILVGDNLLADIKGAKEVGMTTILVRRQNDPTQNDKIRIKPDRVIQRFSQFKKIL